MEERNSITTGHKVKGINDCHYEDGWTDVCGRRCVKQNDCRFVAWLLQVILTVTTVVGSLAASLAIGWTSRVFQVDGGCLLYSNLLVDRVNLTYEGHAEKMMSLDSEQSVWGAHSVCSYTTYTYATAGICRAIWLWMYVMLHKWFRKSNLNPNRRLLPCALILNLALWIFTTIALGFVNEGIKEWCLNLEKQNTNSCQYLSSIPWYTQGAHKTYVYTQILLVSSWVVFICMSLNILTDLLTIFADTGPPKRVVAYSRRHTIRVRAQPLLKRDRARRLTFDSVVTA